MTDINNINCPVEAVISLIGGKYKPIILWHLIDKKLRYNELQKLIPKATPKMLTQQLRELESDGIIIRVVYPVVPPRTEYFLSDFGKTLIPILNAMCDWGNDFLENSI
ncbi:winged helix-turn-helix transcriptional regulator [Terrisporobacter sp.]